MAEQQTSLHDDTEYEREVHRKIAKYKTLKKLYEESVTEYRHRTVEREEAKRKLTDVTTEYRQLCNELESMKSERHAELFQDIQPFADRSAQQTVQKLTQMSLTEMILNVAKEAMHLEYHDELVQTMLDEKSKLVVILNKQIRDSEDNVKRLESQIADLNSTINRLKADVSTQSSGLEMALVDTATDDPAELKRKIKALEPRILELMNHNQNWNTICENLRADVDAANNELREYEAALDEERRKTDKAQSERDDARAEAKEERELRKRIETQCEQLTATVAALDAKVRSLEQRELSDSLQQSSQEVLQQSPAPVVQPESDELIAVKMQVELHKQDYEEERREHNIAKEQVNSLRQQWTTVHTELLNKKEELKKVTADRDSLKETKKKKVPTATLR